MEQKRIRRWVRRIVYCTLGLLVTVIVLITGGLCWLYFTADMEQPTYRMPGNNVRIARDSLRTYRGNWLRYSGSGLWEMRVRGDGFQRGEAIGRLMPDLLYRQEKVFVEQIHRLVPSDFYLRFLRIFIKIFNRRLGANIPEEYRDEIYGISQSCTHEYDMFGTPYERQLNYHAAHDIGHAMQDYMLVGCSSFAVWGGKSDDSHLLIGRNFDFYVGDDFARTKLISFYEPSRGYKFACIGWPGMIGVLSGMNMEGLTVTINAAKSAVPLESAMPISILTREILQYASTIQEAFAIARRHRTFVSESILIGSAKDGYAAIIEKSPEKTVLYERAGQTGQLVCTNHFQSRPFQQDKRNVENIRTSDSPYRYARLKELLAASYPLTPEKAADILRNRYGLRGKELGLTNELALNQFIAHHSVIFQPASLLMWVSTAPWQCGPYVCYDLHKVFSPETSGHQELMEADRTIPEDGFLHTKGYQNLLKYKRMTEVLQGKIKRGGAVNDAWLKAYMATNPSFYYTYELTGDYYASVKKEVQAVGCWKKALTLPIPQDMKKQRIQKKLNSLN